MSLPNTPEMLEAAYDFLRATPPFKRWGLPSGSEVKFGVMQKAWIRGDHEMTTGGRHIIRVSSINTGCTDALLRVLAHEMIHVACADRCVKTTHGAVFKTRALLVCRYHGFDPKMF